MTGFQFTSYEPATGAALWQGHAGDVDTVVAAARTGYAGWAARPLTVRIELMRRVANLIRSRAEPLATLAAREVGKPLWEARAEVEAIVARVEISIAAHGERSARRRIEGALGARTAVRHKPLGVLAAITPFNEPLSVAAGHIIPALIAGNAVVLKPSERAPASAEALVAAFHEAGVPADALHLLPGGPATGRALAVHDGVDGVLFTGSTVTGRALHRLFADQPGRMLSLAMGGNNPIVAWNVPDPYTAAVLIVQSTYAHAGQHCTAARRLIVEDGRHEPLLEQLYGLIDRLTLGEPLAKPQPFLGPVIDNDAADRLQEAFLDLMMKGGRPIRRLDRPQPGLPFLTPALIDVTDIADRPDVELFGPILQVVRVRDFDAAIQEAGRTRHGLAAALLGNSPEQYDRFWVNVRAGVLNWNKPLVSLPANTPLGGAGLSGNHRPGSTYTADACAYPVASHEAETMRGLIGIGLKDD